MTPKGFISTLFGCRLATFVILAVVPVTMAAAAGGDLEELKRGPSFQGTPGDFVGVVEEPILHSRAERMREGLSEIGITQSEIYRIPLRRFGAITTMVRFETSVDLRDKTIKRREAIRVFSALAHHVDGRVTPFVLLKAMSPGSKESSEESHDFFFWQDTSFNWRLISVSPDDYFRTKIEQASSDTTPADLAYWRLSLGAIERANGRDKRAMSLIEAALSGAKSLRDDPFLVRMKSAWTLASIAAQRKDDDRVRLYCQEWALALGDRDISGASYRPLIKVAAQYPRSALRRGVEGHVLAEFTVTEEGRVEDITIVESSPPGVFDQAATKAVSQFQYLPAVEDGKLTRVAGVRNLLRFAVRRPGS